MKEKWKPLFKTPAAFIYQHYDTILILGEKEITFQTSKKIKKIKKDLISYPQDKQDK